MYFVASYNDFSLLLILLQIEVFPGSGVYFLSAQLSLKCKMTSNATQLARILLVWVFDDQTLQASSMKGGANKCDFDAPGRPALDEKKLTAIYSMSLYL